MDFKDFTYSNEDYLNQREKLVDELALDPDVLAFLDRHALQLGEVKELTALKTYAAGLKNCHRCQGLRDCPYQLKGRSLDLEVLSKGHVRLIYRDCPYLSKEKKERDFYRNFIVHDIAARYDKLDLSSKEIDFNAENSKILYVYLKKILLGERNKGLFIYGPFGVGKTYLLIALANSLAKANQKVAFCKYGRLINELRSLYINDRENFNYFFDKLVHVPYLFLDDLGTESASSFGRDDILFNLFDQRLEKGLCTLISSNNDLKTLKINYGHTKTGDASINELNAQRLLERIEKLCDPIAITGIDRRKFET